MLNGYQLEMCQRELVDLYVDLAEDKFDKIRLADILAKHVRELSDDERRELQGE
jgi:prophage maintenance system killer protein